MMTIPPTTIRIFYATESGTADQYALRLRRALQRRGVPRVETSEMGVADGAASSSSWEDLLQPVRDDDDDDGGGAGHPADVTVFIISTTGDGEVPNAMRTLWRTLLRSDLTPSATRFESRLSFAVFGLGDSTYEKFNAAARKFKTRIIQLGAKEVCDSGARDESLTLASPVVGTQDIFDRWVNLKLLPALRLDTIVPSPPSLEPLKRPIVFFSSRNGGGVGGGGEQRNPEKMKMGTMEEEDDDAIITVELTVNARMTAPTWMQDVRHIEMTAVSERLGYRPGDTLLVRPRNEAAVPRESLRRFIRHKLVVPPELSSLDVDDLCFSLPDGKDETVMGYLMGMADLTSTPPQDFFEEASFHCDTSTEQGVEEKEKLLEISRDHELYHSYCRAERRTYLEVVNDFASLRIPLDRFIAAVPRIKPREYSIASSPLADGRGVIHLTVGVLSYTTKLKRVKRGLCSGWLASLLPGTRLKVRIRREGALASAYARLLSEEEEEEKGVVARRPLILLGPGTGVAPMRSIYRHECAISETNRRKLVLYFGCRKEKCDYLYASEFERDKAGVRVAFSRDDPGGNKVYVQSLLKRNGKETCDWIVDEGAAVFVSGNAKRMPADVKETLVQVLEKHRGMTRNEALAVLKRMERERRWVVEAFA